MIMIRSHVYLLYSKLIGLERHMRFGLQLTVANGELSALACGGYLGCKQESLYIWFV